MISKPKHFTVKLILISRRYYYKSENRIQKIVNTNLFLKCYPNVYISKYKYRQCSVFILHFVVCQHSKFVIITVLNIIFQL